MQQVPPAGIIDQMGSRSSVNRRGCGEGDTSAIRAAARSRDRKSWSRRGAAHLGLPVFRRSSPQAAVSSIGFPLCRSVTERIPGSCWPPGSAPSAGRDAPPWRKPGRWIVAVRAGRLRAHHLAADQRALLRFGAQSGRPMRRGCALPVALGRDTYLLEGPPDWSPADVQSKLKGFGSSLRVEPDFLVWTQDVPTIPLTPSSGACTTRDRPAAHRMRISMPGSLEHPPRFARHGGGGHRHRRGLHAPRSGGQHLDQSRRGPGNGQDDDGNGYVDDIHGWDFANGDASRWTTSSTARTWPGPSPPRQQCPWASVGVNLETRKSWR